MKRAGIVVCAFVYKNGIRFFGGKGLHKIWPLGAIYDFVSGTLRTYAWPESHMIFGHRMYAPPPMRGTFALYKGKREEMEFKLFLREIPKGGTVADVGANIGLYTLPFARAAGETGRVFAFEPAPENIIYLKKNIKANGYKNVTVVPKAVGDHDGPIRLYISDVNPGGHQIFDMRERILLSSEISENQKALLEDEASDAPRKSIEVGMTSLDSFFNKYRNQINFIKIDVEGAEGGVMRGMRRILEKNKGVKLHFEFTPSQMRLFGTDPRGFLSELAKLGFTFYDLRNFKWRENALEKVSAEELLARCPGNKSAEVFAKRN